MFDTVTKALTEGLRDHIKLSKSRFETLSWLIFLILQQGSVSLWRLAANVSTPASTDSVRRRFYRFFQHVKLDQIVCARWVVSLLGLDDKPWTLVVDRTNWEFGKTPINILMISVMHHGMGIPLIWLLLPNRGNSRIPARIALLEKLIKAFPKARIACVMGDREFVGRAWIDWFCDNKIDFILRLKENQYIERKGKMTESIRDLAEGLKVGERRVFYRWSQLNQKHDTKRDHIRLVILRLKSGELLALACTGNPYQALAQYRNRWTIECLFAALKTRGFNLEQTHLKKTEKLSTLLSILALATAMSIKTGKTVEKVKPTKRKKHGRKEASIFSLGLHTLRKIFARLCQKTINLIRAILAAKDMPRKAFLHKALPT